MTTAIFVLYPVLDEYHYATQSLNSPNFTINDLKPFTKSQGQNG